MAPSLYLWRCILVLLTHYVPRTHPNTVRQATLAALRQTDLEFTAFHTGYFSDFYGLPHIHSYFPPSVVNIDMEARQAALPGDGNTLHAYTYSFDLAKFVEAALEVPAGEWEETTYCWSDKVTFNQIVALAEEARGMWSFSTTLLCSM